MPNKVESLSQELNSSDPVRRRQAAEGLAQLADGARNAAVELARACDDPDEVVREWVVAALEQLGPPRPDDALALTSLVHAPAADVGYWAATLLGRLEGAASTAVAALGQAVAEHPQAAVRQRAAWALGRIGPAARDAAGTLQAAAASDDARLARLASRALEQIKS
jgi:HEAT repeat protein